MLSIGLAASLVDAVYRRSGTQVSNVAAVSNDFRMLELTLVELASLYRAHDEHGVADWLDETVQGDLDRLPRRVLEMFTRGMGGWMDHALYTNGQVDRSATEHRDELAHQLFEHARERLHYGGNKRA